MESSGKGAAFFSTKLGGSGRPPEAAGASRVVPAAHVRHHAEELLRSVDPSVALCGQGNALPTHQNGPNLQSLLTSWSRQGTPIAMPNASESMGVFQKWENVGADYEGGVILFVQ